MASLFERKTTERKKTRTHHFLLSRNRNNNIPRYFNPFNSSWSTAQSTYVSLVGMALFTHRFAYMFTRFSRLHDLVLSSNSNKCLTPCWRADLAVSLKGSEWSTPFLFTSLNSPMKVQQGCDSLRSCSHWNYDVRRMTCQPGTPSPTCEKSAQIHLEWVKVTIYKKLPSSSFAEQMIVTVLCQGITV